MSLEEQLAGDGARNAAGWVGAAAAAIATILAGYHRLIRHIGKEREGTAISDGGRTVVELMRKELTRLAKQNEALAQRLNDMQIEMIELQQINVEQTATIERLRSQLRAHGEGEA